MTDGPILIKIPIQPVKVRINGADVDAFRIKGLWHAQYGDGDIQAFTNPMKEWLISQDNISQNGPAGTDNMPPMYFLLEPYIPGDFVVDPQIMPGGSSSGINSVTDDDFTL